MAGNGMIVKERRLWISIGSGFAVAIMILMGFAGFANAISASISTDKSSYRQSDTVVISAQWSGCYVWGGSTAEISMDGKLPWLYEDDSSSGSVTLQVSASTLTVGSHKVYIYYCYGVDPLGEGIYYTKYASFSVVSDAHLVGTVQCKRTDINGNLLTYTLAGMRVATTDDKYSTTTDSAGKYSMYVPDGYYGTVYADFHDYVKSVSNVWQVYYAGQTYTWDFTVQCQWREWKQPSVDPDSWHILTRDVDGDGLIDSVNLMADYCNLLYVGPEARFSNALNFIWMEFQGFTFSGEYDKTINSGYVIPKITASQDNYYSEKKLVTYFGTNLHLGENVQIPDTPNYDPYTLTVNYMTYKYNIISYRVGLVAMSPSDKGVKGAYNAGVFPPYYNPTGVNYGPYNAAKYPWFHYGLTAWPPEGEQTDLRAQLAQNGIPDTRSYLWAVSNSLNSWFSAIRKTGYMNWYGYPVCSLSDGVNEFRWATDTAHFQGVWVTK